MLYSDLYLKRNQNVTRFTLIGVVSLVAAVMIYFFTNSNVPLTTASRKTVIKHELVNLTPQQAAIFWQTDEPLEGWIIYSSNQSLKLSASDEQDLNNNRNKHLYHFAVLKDLQPDTTYYYKIISNKGVISQDDGEAFSFKTTRNYIVTDSAKPAYGKVVLPNSQPAEGTFVVLRYPNSYPLVTITKSTGEWLIPMQYVINKSDNTIMTADPNQLADIEVIGKDLKSTIQASVSNMSPLPKTTVLGQSYSFIGDKGNVLPASTKVTNGKKYEIDLLYPKDGAVIPGSQPLVRGKGIPNKDVQININTQPAFSTTATIDAKGSWKITVPSSTRPGIYQLIVTTEDASGRTVGFRRRFILAKSGETVLGEATESATITPTIVESPTPYVITPTYTPTPVITGTYNPTATPVPPTSGVNGSIPYVFAGVSLVVVGVGLVLLF